ncbi:MAG TPA: inositol monophosphatase [Ktedonobacterales bacterium]
MQGSIKERHAATLLTRRGIAYSLGYHVRMIDYQLAVATIRKTLLALRPRLLAAYGNAPFSTKADGSLVTALDVAVEEALKEELATVVPDASFYGEETTHDGLASLSWLIDPIDGTDAFIRGIPLCATLVALLEHGQITLGVIDNFTTGEFYHAIRGHGAYVNGAPIHVSTRPFEQSTVILESRTDFRNDFAYAKALVTCMSASRVAQRVLFGYDLALVAHGKVEGVICHDPYEQIWDIAPGSLLIEEAGGIVRNLRNDTYDPGNLNVIAASHEVYRTLRAAHLV